MDPASFNGLRPEWLEAVAAARWNLFLLPLFGLAPCLLIPAVTRRWHAAVVIGLVFVTMIGTWFAGFGYSETIWNTMVDRAETDAEIDEAMSDTGRVFGPFLIGVPFSFLYTMGWLGLSFGWLAFRDRRRGPAGQSGPRPAETGEAIQGS